MNVCSITQVNRVANYNLKLDQAFDETLPFFPYCTQKSGFSPCKSVYTWMMFVNWINTIHLLLWLLENLLS